MKSIFFPSIWNVRHPNAGPNIQHAYLQINKLESEKNFCLLGKALVGILSLTCLASCSPPSMYKVSPMTDTPWDERLFGRDVLSTSLTWLQLTFNDILRPVEMSKNLKFETWNLKICRCEILQNNANMLKPRNSSQCMQVVWQL